MALGDLLLHTHAVVLEQVPVEGERLAASLVAVEGHVVDVVDEPGLYNSIRERSPEQTISMACRACAA